MMHTDLWTITFIAIIITTYAFAGNVLNLDLKDGRYCYLGKTARESIATTTSSR